MRVVIVGGGIAGLSTATGLVRNGATVDVIEASSGREGTRTGITLLGNALRALDQLGLADACVAVGDGFEDIHIADHTGTVLMSDKPPRTFRPDRPATLGISRAALHEVLTQGAASAGATVRYSTTVASIDQDDDGVDVTLSSGDTLRADLMVAADGTYSATRTTVFGSEIAPAYAGQGAWRVSYPRPADLDGMLLLRTPAGRAAGVIPTGADSCYAFVLETTTERTRIPDDRLHDLMAERLAEFPAPAIQKGAAGLRERVVTYRPFDILLVPAPWHRGRVLLIGDAAHSLTPQMTSGGGLALEDAAVLTRLVADGGTLPDVLDTFSALRYPRAKRVYDASLQICQWEQLASYDRSLMARLMGETHTFLAEAF